MRMRSIYRKIAKEHNTTVAEVKREMQAAIDLAYQNQNISEFEKVKQKNLPCKEEIPTPEELIYYIVRKVSEK